MRNLENTLLNYWSYICDLLNWNKELKLKKCNGNYGKIIELKLQLVEVDKKYTDAIMRPSFLHHSILQIQGW
ncbi:MAG: hypothetical protein ACLR0U_11010 [Enterocloster clostridioformis]